MVISVNRVHLVGRLGADPDVKGRETTFVSLRVATSRSWKDRQTGERREETQWHTVVVFQEGTAKFLADYAHKGDLVYVEGQLETRRWQREDGSDVYFTEVVVRPYGGGVQLQSRDVGDRSSPRQPDTTHRSPAPSGGDVRPDFGRELDDDIPF